jgi:hypothetical protein
LRLSTARAAPGRGKPISWRGLSKRCTSPISTAKVTATRDQKRGAAHHLAGLDHWRHRPSRHDRHQLRLETPQPGRGILDGIDRILKDDLPSRVRELLLCQP